MIGLDIVRVLYTQQTLAPRPLELYRLSASSRIHLHNPMDICSDQSQIVSLIMKAAAKLKA
ncbi:hypothetical protein BgiBS90_021698, partial [Biomphalaria glabrata]